MTILTWDILFLIPVPWIGPVLAPCLLSLSMIILSSSVIYYQEKGVDIHLKPKEWILLIAGSLIVILSFTINFIVYYNTFKGSIPPGKEKMFLAVNTYIPVVFNWWIFIAGEALIIAGIISFIKRAQALKAGMI